mgnify:CR=1 FL=1
MYQHQPIYVMLDSQKVLIDKAKSCKLVGFVSELEQQFSNLHIYNNMTFDERLDKCFEEQKKYAKIVWPQKLIT